MFRFATCLVFLFVSLSAAGCKTTSEADLKPTWLYGFVSIPGEWTKSGTDKVYENEPFGWSGLAQKDVKSNAKMPAVLYMHGCAGLDNYIVVSDLFVTSRDLQ